MPYAKNNSKQFMKLNVKHQTKIKEKSVGSRARQGILRLDTQKKIHKRRN